MYNVYVFKFIIFSAEGVCIVYILVMINVLLLYRNHLLENAIFKISILVQFLWTCRGDAIRCSDEDMEHPVPKHCSGGCETEECCKAAINDRAGDCGGY